MRPLERWATGTPRPLSRLRGFPLPAVVFVAIMVAGGTWAMVTYNRMVQTRQAVDAQWAQVESVLQRRADLIPNLVAATQGYLVHERAIFDAVVQARQAYLTAQPGSPHQVDAATQVQTALRGLIGVIERYPDLRSQEVVLELMDELAGTENRIAIERRRYNDRVRHYNQLVLGFPRSLIASAMGFAPRPYFQAEADAAASPTVH